jgi:carbon storage regulator
MLVLSRKPGEKIHIGSGITITVTEVRGNKVRLGIEAPRDIPIVRAELNDYHAGIDAGLECAILDLQDGHLCGAR